MSQLRYLKAIVVAGWVTGALIWASSLCSSSSVGAAGLSSTRGSARPAAQHKKIGQADCKDCHAEVVKQKNVHPPAADGCTTCHEYSEKDANAEIKLAAGGNDLCFTCHTEKQEDLKNKKSKHPPAEDNCTNCHNPHSADAPHILKAAVPDLCYICHTDKEEDVKTKKFVHRPVKELGCLVCHNPHATDASPLLKAEPPGLCLKCHDRNLTYKKNEAGQIVIFADTRIPADFPDKATKILLDPKQTGHPYIAHPVGGIDDPSRKGKKLSCVSCHNPHAGNVPRMFQKDVTKRELCLTCHK